MLIPFGLGNQVELRYRHAFPHLSSHYAVLKYHNSWGNILDGVPMECFVDIQTRAAEAAKEYLLQNLPNGSVVLSSLTNMLGRFAYLHPASGCWETLTPNSGSKMEIISKKHFQKTGRGLTLGLQSKNIRHGSTRGSKKIHLVWGIRRNTSPPWTPTWSKPLKLG